MHISGMHKKNFAWDLLLPLMHQVEFCLQPVLSTTLLILIIESHIQNNILVHLHLWFGQCSYERNRPESVDLKSDVDEALCDGDNHRGVLVWCTLDARTERSNSLSWLRKWANMHSVIGLFSRRALNLAVPLEVCWTLPTRETDRTQRNVQLLPYFYLNWFYKIDFCWCNVSYSVLLNISLLNKPGWFLCELWKWVANFIFHYLFIFTLFCFVPMLCFLPSYPSAKLYSAIYLQSLHSNV